MPLADGNGDDETGAAKTAVAAADAAAKAPVASTEGRSGTKKSSLSEELMVVEVERRVSGGERAGELGE